MRQHTRWMPILAMIAVGLVTGTGVAYAANISGTVIDAQTSQPILGASIVLVQTKWGTVTDKNGRFVLSGIRPGRYIVEVRSLGYAADSAVVTIPDANDDVTVDFALRSQAISAAEVLVRGRADRETDASARLTERNAPSIVTVLSAESIARYPDPSIAEVAKRIPGLSITRVRGEAREVIVRGMEPHYNSIMVDGLKVPSPSTNTRNIQLDYLPSDILQRVEVTKALTPDMEGDAIGGAINLVMRTAPDTFLLRLRGATGYNTLLFNNDLINFRSDSILPDPLEVHGAGYLTKPSDFTRDNLKLTRSTAPPNIIGEFTVGSRMLDNHLGFIVAGSMQRTSQYSETIRNYDAVDVDNNLYLIRRQYRLHGHVKTKWGANAKVDYIFDDKNDMQLSFNGFMRQNMESRIINDTNFIYSPVLYLHNRTVFQTHWLANLALSGHNDLGLFTLKWHGGIGEARQTKPDRAEFITSEALVGDSVVSKPVFYAAIRDWQHNEDRDAIAGIDASWKGLSEYGIELSSGFLYRGKSRGNYVNEYRLVPVPDSLKRVNEFVSVDAQEWNVENTGGTPEYANNNYSGNEDVTAAYIMGTWNSGSWNLLAGVRAEITHSQFSTHDVNALAQITATKNYADILPSLHLRYTLNEESNLHFSVGQSISRPNYYDLVPYNIIGDEFRERGNPQLRRTRSANIDLKYEIYPEIDRWFSIGVFAKHIVDPIETTLDLSDPALPTIVPKNLGDATNVGAEISGGIHLLDYFDLRMNYTYTPSSITTDKILNDRDASRVITVSQTRSLQGQSEHIGNIALAFNQPAWGTFGQASFSFTGQRIAEVSAYKDLDHYQNNFPMLDLSFEQKVAGGFSLFLRMTNLLNASYNVEVLNGPLIEEERFGETLTLGVNYRY